MNQHPRTFLFRNKTTTMQLPMMGEHGDGLELTTENWQMVCLLGHYSIGYHDAYSFSSILSSEGHGRGGNH
jgi:hypothetical protein